MAAQLASRRVVRVGAAGFGDVDQQGQPRVVDEFGGLVRQVQVADGGVAEVFGSSGMPADVVRGPAGAEVVAERSVMLVVLVVVVIDVALQALGILNQLRVFAVSHEARSRLNTAYVTRNFIGGAIGSAAASVLWSTGGWTAVSIAGATLSCLALAVWAAGRRGPLVVPDPR